MLVSRSGPTMMARIAVMKALNSGADGNLIGCHGKLIQSAQSGETMPCWAELRYSGFGMPACPPCLPPISWRPSRSFSFGICENSKWIDWGVSISGATDIYNAL